MGKHRRCAVPRPGVSGQRGALSWRTRAPLGWPDPDAGLCRLSLPPPCPASRQPQAGGGRVGSGGEGLGQCSPPGAPRPAPAVAPGCAPRSRGGRDESLEAVPPLARGRRGEKRAATSLELWVDRSRYFRRVSSWPYPGTHLSAARHSGGSFLNKFGIPWESIRR